MKLNNILSAVFVALATDQSAASVAPRASSGAATVDLGTSTGAARFLGSGFIYGFPDNGTSADSSIPDHFATDIKFNACRAGGAQTPYPGWAGGGYDGYIGRFNSTLSNYRTARKYGADFILLPHDLWGSDGSLGGGGLYPGDDGDWSQMEAFLEQVVRDLEDNDMLEGLVFDIWNEPDIDTFWARSWDQYLEYYVRAHRIIRAKLPGTLISGPSGASVPDLQSSTWTSWLAAISANDTVPDIYSWHQIGDTGRELDRVIPDFNTLLGQHNLPRRAIDINEYAARERQNPANSAFYLAQLERHNLRGLRANWGSGAGLHDLMADLVFKDSDGGYEPNGDWQTYRYYAGMTGDRVATNASPDLGFDVFGTVSGNSVKVLAGTQSLQASYQISVSGLGRIGLPADGSLSIRSLRFDFDGRSGLVQGPVDLGTTVYTYTSDTLHILVETPTNSTAFAFEFSGGQ
ncbi:glycoside hydrolase [Colletotrichum caudatum]|nr:glycoside hydrolase [Colletotrichum caudatum]